MVERMHHHHVRFGGPLDCVAAAVDDLYAQGLDGDGEHGFAFASDERLVGVVALSERHRRVVVLVTTFELAGDQVEELVLRAGLVTSRHRRPVIATIDEAAGLPWGTCDEEGGEPLDPALLRDAARTIALHPDFGRRHAPAYFGRAVLLGEALGDLCRIVADGRPTPASMDVVVCVAVSATAAGVRCRPGLSSAMLAHECAWRLTRACAHAGHEKLWEPSWADSLPLLVGCTAAAVDDLTEAEGVATEDGTSRFSHMPQAINDEFVMPTYVYGEATTGGLLSTCLQVLAQFDTRLGACVEQ
jgi:hypothetical protein